MKSIVVDANVFHAFFYESVKGEAHPERTALAAPLFAGLGISSIAFLDEGKQIEQEWRDVCKMGEEWFTNWLAESFANGGLYEIEHSKDPQIARRYKQVGFPTGRDIWYVRVAHGLAGLCKKSRPCLIAEDVDFFDPTKKKSANKKDIFLNGKGPVADLLRSDGIDVSCIRNFLAAEN